MPMSRQLRLSPSYRTVCLRRRLDRTCLRTKYVPHRATQYQLFTASKPMSIFTQRRSVAIGVVCFQHRVFVCVFVCQHDNFRTSKHRMVKLGGRCIVQKSRPSSNVGVIAPWVRTPKMWHWATTWENQRL